MNQIDLLLGTGSADGAESSLVGRILVCLESSRHDPYDLGLVTRMVGVPTPQGGLLTGQW